MALNVLIVDDSDIIRAMIAKTLRLAQLPLGDVYEASNGREALGVLDECWVDLVLADLNMPVMSGIDMIKTMRQREATAQTPVIVVSSEGATARMQELMGAGVAAWIRKPFTPEEIRDVVGGVTANMGDAAEHEELLNGAFSLVMEQFAFCFPENATKDCLPDPGQDLVLARIDFGGATCGTLSLAAPAALCSEWAANILGVEPEHAAARDAGPDALGEVINMTAGHVATGIEADAPTDLHPPVVARLERAQWDHLAAAASSRHYLVEEWPVIAVLGVRPKVARALGA